MTSSEKDSSKIFHMCYTCLRYLDIELDCTSSLFVDKLYVKSHLDSCYFDNNEVLIETPHSL